MFSIASLLVQALPSLIKGAEQVFAHPGSVAVAGPIELPSAGQMKKQMVLAAVSALYDGLGVPSVLPWRSVNQKKLVLDLIGTVIDNIVPEVLTDAAPAVGPL